MKKLYIFLGIVIIILGLLWFVTAQKEKLKGGALEEINQNIEQEIEYPAYEGKDHIEADAPTPDYSSIPPTSGPHSPLTESHGFSKTTLALEKLVHNLEHGDIVIYYSPNLEEAQLEELKRLSNIKVNNSGVIAHPYETEYDIVLTAWERRLSLEEFDLVQMEQFIYDHINTFDHGEWLDESKRPPR